MPVLCCVHYSASIVCSCTSPLDLLYLLPLSLQETEPGYRRLTLTQPVGLKHSGYVLSLEGTEKVKSTIPHA